MRENELHYINDLETKKLELQTKICMHEFKLGVPSPVAGRSTDFEVSKNIRLFLLLMRRMLINILCCCCNVF